MKWHLKCLPHPPRMPQYDGMDTTLYENGFAGGGGFVGSSLVGPAMDHTRGHSESDSLGHICATITFTSTDPPPPSSPPVYFMKCDQPSAGHACEEWSIIRLTGGALRWITTVVRSCYRTLSLTDAFALIPSFLRTPYCSLSPASSLPFIPHLPSPHSASGKHRGNTWAEQAVVVYTAPRQLFPAPHADVSFADTFAIAFDEDTQVLGGCVRAYELSPAWHVGGAWMSSKLFRFFPGALLVRAEHQSVGVGHYLQPRHLRLPARQDGLSALPRQHGWSSSCVQVCL